MDNTSPLKRKYETDTPQASPELRTRRKATLNGISEPDRNLHDVANTVNHTPNHLDLTPLIPAANPLAAAGPNTPPNLVKFIYLFRDFMRAIFRPPTDSMSHETRLLGLQDELNCYFFYHRDYDFSTEPALSYMVEIEQLMHSIDIFLGVRQRRMNWPLCVIGQDEKKELQRKANLKIKKVLFRQDIVDTGYVEGDRRGVAGGGEPMEEEDEEKVNEEAEKDERERRGRGMAIRLKHKELLWEGVDERDYEDEDAPVWKQEPRTKRSSYS